MNRHERHGESANIGPIDPGSPDLGDWETSADFQSMTSEDIGEPDNGRPTIPGETDDGLDEMDEEVRRQAEDLPADTSGRL